MVNATMPPLSIIKFSSRRSLGRYAVRAVVILSNTTLLSSSFALSVADDTYVWEGWDGGDARWIFLVGAPLLGVSRDVSVGLQLDSFSL